MKYLQDLDGNILQLPNEVQIFRRIVTFTNFAISGDFSSDFEVPNNSETRKTIGFYSLNQINKLIQKPFHFYIDGNAVSTGRVFVRGVADNLDLFYVAGNGNWMNQITGSLKDLDLSEYDTVFSASSVIASMTATEGVIFPVIDWSYFYRKLTNAFMITPITGVSVDSFYDFYACFHVKTILKKLLNSYGYILAGNLLNDPIYNDLVITPEFIRSAAYSSAIAGPWQSMSGEKTSGSSGSAKLEMNEGTDYFNDGNDRLVFPVAATGVTLTFTYTRTDSTINARAVQIRKNGTSILETIIAAGESTGSGSIRVDIAANDYFELYHFGLTSSLPPIEFVISAPRGTWSLQASYPSSDNIAIVSDILPEMDQFAFIKYVAQRFNCLIDFEEKSQTLTFTLLDSLKREDAVDLTDKIVNYRMVPGSGYSERNFLRTTEADELKGYKTADLNYGDALIESDGDSEQDVITTPMRPAETFTNQNLDWLMTNVPLVKLEDADTGTAFDSVSSSAGFVNEFVNSAATNNFTLGEVVRIESDEYNGIAVIFQTDTNSIKVYGNVPFTSTDTGKIYKQKIIFPSIGSRELIVCRGIDVNLINTGNPTYGSINLKVIEDSLTYPIDSIAWAYFAKPNIGTDLDYFRYGLNYGPVTGTGNIAFSTKFHKNLRNIIRGSRLEAQILLTQVDFNNLNLARFVYLRTKDFSGYFFISDFTDGFTDQFTPVTMNLIFMDNG